MKILHVVPSLDPSQGGLPVACISLAVAEADLGCCSDVLSFTPVSSKVAKFIEVPPGVGSVRLELQTLQLITAILNSGSYEIEAIIGKYQLVHFHGIWEPEMLALMRVAFKLSVPYCISPHGMLYPYCLAQKSLKKKIALLLGYRKVITRADAIRCLNADESVAVEAMDLPTRRAVVPNGIDVRVGEESTSPPDAMILERPYWLFVGRIHEIKGLDTLVRAYVQYRADGGCWRLLLVGPNAGFRGALEEIIAAAGLVPDDVMFVGPVYGNGRFAYFHHASGYVQASRHETFSVSVLEALAAGVPVVLTESCHFPELEATGAGLITDGSVSSLANSMLQFEMDTLGRGDSREAALRLAEDYNWPDVARRMLKLYRSVFEAAEG